MTPLGLSLQQRAIVEAPISHILVVTGEGSGKTRVLTERVRFLLERDPLDGVLALTFTNKAADEMRGRLAGIEDLERRTFVGTIHSFAQSIIEKHGRHIGYDQMPHIFERDEDRGRFLQQAIDAYAPGVQDTAVTYGGADNERRVKVATWLGKISQLKRELLTDDEIEESYPADNTLEIYREYNAILRQHNGVDFDDLLVLAYRVLSEMTSVAGLYARNYPHVCIDEAQDLNKAQYQLIRALCLDRAQSLMMVGDPNQAIYGFNGSSSDFMMKSFVSDFSARKFGLIENYRSTKQVLKPAVLLKPTSQDVERAALEGRAEFFIAQDEAAEADWICGKIQSLLDSGSHLEIEGEITLEKMTVLARNRYVFKTLQESLDDRGWRWHLKKTPGAPVFESRIGKLVDLCIRVILNPQDALHFRELCAVVNVKAEDGHSVAQCIDHWETLSPDRFSDIGQLLPAAITLINKENRSDHPDMIGVVSALMEAVQALDGTGIAKEEIDLALNDLEDFKTHWDSYVRSMPSAASLSLSAFRNAMAMGKTHPDVTPKGLALSTVHTMKGLEKDIVFLMGMGQGTFPDYRAVEAGGSKMREELNNAYVAVTRARRFIFISYPKTKKMPWGGIWPQKPSVFLKQMNLIRE